MRSLIKPGTEAEPTVSFRPREFRGSRFRCLLATSQIKPRISEWLNALVHPHASVSEHDIHMPAGFARPEEAKLGETRDFLDDTQRERVVSWWLAAHENANTPNWDLVSTCTIGDREGLILAEAKAHVSELKEDDCCTARNKDNYNKICSAMDDASKELGNGWNLNPNGRYQLSNRFAWAWKIATLGKPVVLVYLGFLNAEEMQQPFNDATDWETRLRNYARGCVPDNAWESPKIIAGVPLIPLIRSAEVNIRAL